jgi:hypothetical protein
VGYAIYPVSVLQRWTITLSIRLGVLGETRKDTNVGGRQDAQLVQVPQMSQDEGVEYLTHLTQAGKLFNGKEGQNVREGMLGGEQVGHILASHPTCSALLFQRSV